MRHGDYLLLRAGGEGDGCALAGEKTGRRRPDAASRARYQHDATGVYPTFGHFLLAETYVLAAIDTIIHPPTLSSLPLAYPTHRPAAGGAERGWCQVR